MRRSIRSKITVWFTLVVFLVSAAATILTAAATWQGLTRSLRTHIQVTVRETAKKISLKQGTLTISPGAHFQERGVYRILCDSELNLLHGELPFQTESSSLTFHSESTRISTFRGNQYLEYDTQLTLEDGSIYWLKGIIPLNDEVRTVKTMLCSNAILSVILLLISWLGGNLIVRQVFAPVEKIRRTAEEITNSGDLSNRIALKSGNDELHALAETFDEMLDHLQLAFEHEKQFTSDLSHDLRTPLAVILSQCECLRSSTPTQEDYDESMDTIERQAGRMQTMVSELLTITRMESGVIRQEPEESDIGELLHFICDEQEAMNHTKIQLVRKIEPGIICTVDRDLLSRLFINLLANAYQYTNDPGTVTVSLHKEGNTVCIRVADTGIGISEEDLPRIWDRFFRADSTRSGGNSSSGLGLSIVKSIATLLHGQLSVTSTLGKGTSFTFSYPIH